MRKNQLIENLKHTYCRLKPSPIHGIGVFAIRNIPEGINPFPGVVNPRWYKVNPREFSEVGDGVLKMFDDLLVSNEDGTYWVPHFGLNGTDMSFYVNHSDTPNLKTIDDGVVFVTLRNINNDEELTIDYGTYDANWKNK